MVSPSDNHTSKVFIAGYRDITQQEFANYYHEELDDAMTERSGYLISDEPGVCDMALEYLRAHQVSPLDITIFRSTVDCDPHRQRPYSVSEYQVVVVEGGETERYEAMTEAIRDYMDYEHIIWVRQTDTLDGLSGGDVLDMRFTGPREAERCISAASVRDCMDFYDEIA